MLYGWDVRAMESGGQGEGDWKATGRGMGLGRERLWAAGVWGGFHRCLRKKLGMINGHDKLSHLERQENLSPITSRKLSEIADGSVRCL